MQSAKRTAVVLGVISAFFFSITFIVNRLMSLNGGSWIWSASLRFYWMLPIFAIIVACRKNFSDVLREIKMAPGAWIVWSTTGFGVFYALLTYGAAYGPSWLVASTWQFTIIAGMVLAPLINSSDSKTRGPIRTLFLFSGMILLGIMIMQIAHAKSISAGGLLVGVLPVLIAAFAYPLGNRKIMQLVNGRLDVYQRILAMLICSLPFWLLLSGYALFIDHQLPQRTQYLQTFIVGISSGAIATSLFFAATDRVRNDEGSLAAVEATQSTEVVFALAGEVLVLETQLPDVYAVIGLILVVGGMILHSLKK